MPDLAPQPDHSTRLRDEITCLEQRLERMGMDGDCAYERAISRLYHTLLEERRQQLAALHSA